MNPSNGGGPPSSPTPPAKRPLSPSSDNVGTDDDSKLPLAKKPKHEGSNEGSLAPAVHQEQTPSQAAPMDGVVPHVIKVPATMSGKKWRVASSSLSATKMDPGSTKFSFTSSKVAPFAAGDPLMGASSAPPTVDLGYYIQRDDLPNRGKRPEDEEPITHFRDNLSPAGYHPLILVNLKGLWGPRSNIAAYGVVKPDDIYGGPFRIPESVHFGAGGAFWLKYRDILEKDLANELDASKSTLEAFVTSQAFCGVPADQRGFFDHWPLNGPQPGTQFSMANIRQKRVRIFVGSFPHPFTGLACFTYPLLIVGQNNNLHHFDRMNTIFTKSIAAATRAAATQAAANRAMMEDIVPSFGLHPLPQPTATSSSRPIARSHFIFPISSRQPQPTAPVQNDALDSILQEFDFSQFEVQESRASTPGAGLSVDAIGPCVFCDYSFDGLPCALHAAAAAAPANEPAAPAAVTPSDQDGIVDMQTLFGMRLHAASPLPPAPLARCPNCLYAADGSLEGDCGVHNN